MSKYIVTGTVTISCQVEVEAKSEAEARKLAADAPMLTLCYQCSNGEPGSWNTSGELDGTPTIESVRERTLRGGRK
jgi:hypothetical protein